MKCPVDIRESLFSATSILAQWTYKVAMVTQIEVKHGLGHTDFYS